MKNQDIKDAYGESKSAPTEAHAPEGYSTQGGELEKGMSFYEEGRKSLEKPEETLSSIMTEAYIKFTEWGHVGSKFGRGMTRQIRDKKIREYYEQLMDKFKDDPDKQQQAAKLIQSVHQAVFNYPLPKYV